MAIDNNEETQIEYDKVKYELKTIETNELKGNIIRSKVKFIEEGEKPTRYFFNLEKHNALKKHIRKITLPGGTTTTQPEEISEYLKSFYENLYTSKTDYKSADKDYFLNLQMKSLTEKEKDNCEGMIGKEEVEKTLKLFHANKSPGNDGITIEFYKKFWDSIKDTLIECYNYSFEKGELSVSQKQAIVTLIEKHGKDRLYIKNWRLISLLNVDYKILTKTLSQRMRKVLANIINEDQSGYIEERQIFNSIRTIQDLMEITKNDNLPGIMLQIDFEKAFDSIEWNFMLDVLKKFNFGENFIKWVKLIYTNISSCIINNGTTLYFALSRGLRQGDPLSGYLFIIVIELLAERIRQDSEIHGIKFGASEVKLTQYVDDLTIFIKDETSAKQVFIRLENFMKYLD